MHQRITPAQVIEQPEITKLLNDEFDLILPTYSSNHGKILFELQDGSPYQILAQQATGDYFVSCPHKSLILYVCHEGKAGVIAKDFQEMMQIIIALPYWNDLLKFSFGGQLEIMRKTAVQLENELHVSLPEINSLRKFLFRRLHLEPLPDPINTLYTHVCSSDDMVTVIDPTEKNRFEGLFGTWEYRG